MHAIRCGMRLLTLAPSHAEPRARLPCTREHTQQYVYMPWALLALALLRKDWLAALGVSASGEVRSGPERYVW